MSNNLYDKLSEERKRLQQEGLVPEWYTTGGYQLFKEKYEYETNGRSVRGQFERIARTAAKHLRGTPLERDAETKFFDLLWKGWVSPSTPVLANMGTSRGTPVSCSGTVVEDSIDGFYSNLHEVACLTKNGFGTASDFSHIRPRGTPISTGGRANGVVPVIKEHVNAMRTVSQGNTRRGSWAVYLDIEHGDFWELANLIMAEPDDLNVGWTIKDSFIKKLNEKDKEAVARFKRAMKVKMVTGKGYFFFIDKANNHRPKMYVDKSMMINNSQLCSEIMLFNDEDHTYTCQPGFAKVIKEGVGLTDFDNIKVGDKVWSKEGWTTVVNKVSSGIKPVLEYRTSLGSFIGTEDHRVVELGEKVEVRHAESIDGVKYEYQKVEQIVPEFVIDGLVTGDGTIRNGKVQLCVGEKDQDYYTSEISHMIEHQGHSFFRNVKINTTGCQQNTYDRVIDITRLTDNNKIASFLRGLFSANGSVVKQSDQTVQVVLTCTSKNVADNTMLLLQALGLSPKIYKTTGKEIEFSNGTYLCKDAYHVVINKSNDIVYFESNIGFIQKYKCQLLAERKHTVPKNRRLNAEIKEVNYIGDFEVFHIEVDNESHTYWTGGLDVSNCVLSSMNASKYDEWKETDAVYWATIFLDCVAEEFIQFAKDKPGMEKAVRFTEKGRALGLGLCGLHTLFMKKMLPFESLEAHMLSQEISKLIWTQAQSATKDLAVFLGEPQWCRGYGVRNTHLIAIAPTKSTALLMGGVSEGINPDPAMTYNQSTAAGEIDRINPVLLDLMKSKGVYSAKTVQEISDKQGSVQHVTWLTDEEKAVFKTAFEINQKAILRLASARKRYIDQWQSLNLFFDANEDPAWIVEVHKEAFEDPNILALYYIYTQAGVQASKGECEACQ
jgi:ribonucleotide reductase alpha subunit